MMVGAAGFELATFRTQTGRATRLRYAPIRKMPVIEGVRSLSAFRWLHWSPRSLRDHASPRLRHAPIIKKKYTLKQAPPGGRKRSAALGVSMAPLEPSIPPGPTPR